MKLWKTLVLCVACTAAFSLSIPDDADARRIGGGRSFGGSSLFSRPAPSAPSGSISQQPGTTLNRQATNPGSGSAAAASSGMSRGMGGLFGGLLAGTLLGSLLMGGGFAGGGLLDLVLIGLVVYFGLRFFRKMRGSSHDSGASRQAYRAPASRGETGGTAWDNLRSQPSASSFGTSSAAAAHNLNSPTRQNIPVDFDQEEFLRGAKMVYVRLQESWDKRDLEDVAQFATEAVLQGLREQLVEEPDPTTTDLLMINASLMEVKKDGNEERAAVFFDVLMRENTQAQQPEQVREVWHFLRHSDRKENWKLDGIQQMQ